MTTFTDPPAEIPAEIQPSNDMPPNRFYDLPAEIQERIFIIRGLMVHKEKSAGFLEEITQERGGPWEPFWTMLMNEPMDRRVISEYWAFRDWFEYFDPLFPSGSAEEAEEQLRVHTLLDSQWNRFLHEWEYILEHYDD